MGEITVAKAFANNEVSFVAWGIDGMIDGCLGYGIAPIRTDGSEPQKGLPAWVPFQGQDNGDLEAQERGVGSVQKRHWRTLRYARSVRSRTSGIRV